MVKYFYHASIKNNIKVIIKLTILYIYITKQNVKNSMGSFKNYIFYSEIMSLNKVLTNVEMTKIKLRMTL